MFGRPNDLVISLNLVELLKIYLIGHFLSNYFLSVVGKEEISYDLYSLIGA
jgi:hypothetical protein